MKYLLKTGSFSISEPLDIGNSKGLLILFNCGCGSEVTSYISVRDFLLAAKSIKDTLSRAESNTIFSTISRWGPPTPSNPISYNPYNLKCSKCGCCKESIKETNSKQSNNPQDKAIEILKDADEETCNHLKRIILEYENYQKGMLPQLCPSVIFQNYSFKEWINL